MDSALAFVECNALEKGLDVSFSRITYKDIASHVGLDPLRGGDDAPIFPMGRARIPLSLFRQVVQDVDLTMKQYGKPVQHDNGEARSRFLAPVRSIIHPIRTRSLTPRSSLIVQLPAFIH